jgi:pimeloyl-ACP methyl ester carboxylesterase
VIVPSRSGYLRTPLTCGKTPREQAAMYATLPDVLNIPQAAFFAISQSGASSLEFAQAYPERCLGRVFVSAFTRPPQSDEFRPALPYLKALMSLDFAM